jgi:hypothetical protein
MRGEEKLLKSATYIAHVDPNLFVGGFYRS